MTNSRRAAAMLAAAVLALSAAACDTADDPAPDDGRAAPATDASSADTSQGGVPLPDAIEALEVADEQREGYDRDRFKHWVDEDGDGCDTRREVLIAEAVKAPEQGDRCSLTGGEWLSYYDEETVTDASKLDIDHMVPLAEAWDSGAHAWDDELREQFANDLDADRSLVAVTAKTNRSKGDKDPADWLPPAASAHCTYLVDWVATKTRWELTVDQEEKVALEKGAAGCDGDTVEADTL